MIESINKEIDNFLISLPGIDKNQLASISSKYSSTVTDDLKKGHITSNVCMIAASILQKNPKELASELKNILIQSGRYESVESAGPGFINLTLKRADFISTIEAINKAS